MGIFKLEERRSPTPADWRSRVDVELSEVRAEVNSIKKDIGNLLDAFTNFTQRTSDHQKTKWPPIIAGFAVTVAILSSIFSVYNSRFTRDIDRVETAVDAEKTRSLNHDMQDESINSAQNELIKRNVLDIQKLMHVQKLE